MTRPTSGAPALAPETQDFYIRTLGTLNASGVPFLLGGAYAFARYTGIERHTKDLDVFTRPGDAPRLLAALQDAGYETEVSFPHWLGKAHHGEDFVDVIYGSANASTGQTWRTSSARKRRRSTGAAWCSASDHTGNCCSPTS